MYFAIENAPESDFSQYWDINWNKLRATAKVLGVGVLDSNEFSILFKALAFNLGQKVTAITAQPAQVTVAFDVHCRMNQVSSWLVKRAAQ